MKKLASHTYTHLRFIPRCVGLARKFTDPNETRHVEAVARNVRRAIEQAQAMRRIVRSISDTTISRRY